MNALAFNRKYRSQQFGDLVGQGHVATTLRNAVVHGRVAHAYLFCGPRGVGKTSAARILAKAINCPEAQGGEPCGACASCQSIQDGRAIDVLEADAASNRGIDDIRNLRERIGLAPAAARYKFYILDEAHMLTTEASNALLKTLEEPPPHAIFVLVTTDPQKLPETIVSRCQRLDFRRITVADAVGRLAFVCDEEGIQPEPGLLELLARSAAGSLRDAEGGLDQLVAFAGKQPTLADARAVLGAAGPEAARQLIRLLVDDDAAGALRLVNDLVGQGADPRRVAIDVVGGLRDLLLLRTSERLIDLIEAGPEVLPELQALAEALPPTRIVELIRVFQPGPATRGGLRPQLPLEMAVVEAEAVLREASAATPRIPASPLQARPAEASPVAEVARQPVAPPVRSMAESRPPMPPTPLAAPQSPTPGSSEKNGHPPLPAPQTGILVSGALVNEARRRWNEILDLCGGRSRPIQAILRSGRPIGDEEDTLVLGFPYPFHRERIEDQPNRIVVEEAASQVLGRKVRVRCTLTPRETLNAADPFQAAMDEPLVKAAVDLGARIRSVTAEGSEEST